MVQGIWAYVVPAVKGPQPSVEGDGPVADVVRGVVEPALLLPVGVCVAAVGEARGSDDDAYDEDAEQSNKLEEHEDIGAAGAELGGDAVEGGDEDQADEGNGLVEPGAGVDGVCANDGADEVLSKDDGDDGSRARLEDGDGAPGEEEAGPLAKDLGEVDLGAAVEGDGAAELSVAGGARPGQDAGDDPDDERGARGAGVLVDLRGRGEDAAANDEANDERQAVDKRQALVLLERAGVEGAGRVEGRVGGRAEGRVALGGAGEGEQVGRKVKGRRDAVGALVARAEAVVVVLGRVEERVVLVVERQAARRGRARRRRVVRGAARGVRRRGQRRELERVAGRRWEVGMAAGHGAGQATSRMGWWWCATTRPWAGVCRQGKRGKKKATAGVPVGYLLLLQCLHAPLRVVQLDPAARRCEWASRACDGRLAVCCLPSAANRLAPAAAASELQKLTAGVLDDTTLPVCSCPPTPAADATPLLLSPRLAAACAPSSSALRPPRILLACPPRGPHPCSLRDQHRGPHGQMAAALGPAGHGQPRARADQGQGLRLAHVPVPLGHAAPRPSARLHHL